MTRGLLLTDFANPRIISLSEEHRTNNVSVTMEWISEEGVQYIISVTPSASITVIGSIIVELLLLYNTEYNVSMEAAAACQRIAPSNVRLFYGELSSQDIYFIR